MADAVTVLGDVQDNVRRIVRTEPRRVAEHIAAAIDRRVVTDTGGDRRLSGLGNHRPIVTDVAVTTRAGTTRATIVPAPPRNRAPIGWLNGGTRPRRQGSGRHPGTAGKRTWDQPADRALADAARDTGGLAEEVLR